MAAWIKMPLDMEVCLGPGNFVLDGVLADILWRRRRADTARLVGSV